MTSMIDTPEHLNGTSRALAAMLALFACATLAYADDGGPKRWKDDELTAAYTELKASGGLEPAVRSPALPSGPPSAAFLDALAWHSAGMPERAGTLTLAGLDGATLPHVRSYLKLLAAKAEKREANDYPRTRTWKLIQKLTMLREEMSKASRGGRYAYPALRKGPADRRAREWDRGHTLRSAEEFAQKVCRASYARPVLVKYGNTNCTQCMLFELIGSIRALAESPELKGSVDVYKVWWGFAPDSGWAGMIRQPERLDALAKTEGVASSPFFVVYRNGRRYPCGDAFPDESGPDERLKSCLGQEFGEAPAAGACAQAPAKAAEEGR